MNECVKRKQTSWTTLWSYLLALCFCLPLLTSCEGKKIIVNSLDEKDANEIIVFLDSRNIEATKVQAEAAGGGGGSKEVLWNIAVPTSDASEAMRLLNAQGLPRRTGTNLLGQFSSSGLVPSDLQEKIKYRAALAAELASTIRKQEGILDADVLVSFPEEDPLNPGKSKGKITAAVWVQHNGILDNPNSHMMSRIKRWVASSVTGLNPDDVTVIGERSRLSERPEGLTPAAEEEKSFVKIWSVAVATDSVDRFRMIFFSFSIALLIMLIALAWTIWKVHPILHAHGGFKALLSFHALGAEEAAAKPSEKRIKPASESSTDEAKNPKKDENKTPPKGNIDKGIDET